MVVVNMEVIVMKEDVVVIEAVDISGVIPRFLLDLILFAHRPRQVFYLLSDLVKYFICSPTSSSILSALRPRQVFYLLSDLVKYFICSPTSSSTLSALRPRQVCLVLRLLRQ